MSDVNSQPFDLVSRWTPQSWEVTVTGGGKTLRLECAQPDYGAVATPPTGLGLEAVYVGLGSEADFVGQGGATCDVYHDFHTDRETPETVPWTGPEATARAYANIIDEVSKLTLSRRLSPGSVTASKSSGAIWRDGTCGNRY